MISIPFFGYVDDDIIGAGDVAFVAVKGALSVLLVNGTHTEPQQAGAVVIALKSRTQPRGEAVADSMAELRWMAGHGNERRAKIRELL